MPVQDSALRDEYWAGRKSVAIADRSAVGRIAMVGADALDLLHRLSTQDLRGLKPSMGAVAVLTTEKGRIIDLLVISHLGDRLLILTSPGNQAAVLAWLERYTFAEDAAASDVTPGTGLFAILGPGAGALAERLTGQAVASLPLYHHVHAILGDAPATLARAQEPGGGFHVFVPDRAQAGMVWAGLLAAAGGMRGRAICAAAYEMLRIEAGLPAFGAEITDQYNPLEAGMGPFISWSKGCYIGQEVIARLDAYKKVQRRLVGLVLPSEEPPLPGTPLFAEGKEAGVVTSATATPGRETPIGLGYVREGFAEPGALLSVGAGEGRPLARVTALPFPPV